MKEGPRATMPPFAAGKAIRDPLNPDGREMRRMEAEMQRAVLAALRRLDRDLFSGVTAESAALVLVRLDSEPVLAPFRDRIIAALQAVALAGAEFGRWQVERAVFGTVKQQGPISFDWELANAEAAEWALRYGYELVRAIVKTTRKRLQREISNFITSGETLLQLRRRLEPVFGPVRAEAIAVTEVTRAYAEGNVASWRESGVIQKQEWRTANDELVCPICGAKAGQVYALDDRAGTPPAHVRCRCWVVPYVEVPKL